MANFTKKAIKYVLAEEMFSDYLVEADANYHKLQKKNNPKNSAVQGYVNLSEAILQLFYENYRFFLIRQHTKIHTCTPCFLTMFWSRLTITWGDIGVWFLVFLKNKQLRFYATACSA